MVMMSMLVLSRIFVFRLCKLCIVPGCVALCYIIRLHHLRIALLSCIYQVSMHRRMGAMASARGVPLPAAGGIRSHAQSNRYPVHGAPARRRPPMAAACGESCRRCTTARSA